MLKFSILIPVYKGAKYLRESLESIKKQNFDIYELIIIDDNHPTDKQEIKNTKKIIASFKFRNLTYIKNKKNIGSQKTINKLATIASGEILFFLCQDDVLGKGAIQKTHDAFLLDNNIGAVTRPYFWFDDDMRRPIRAVFPYNSHNDSIISIWGDEKELSAIFGSVGQISGLAYKKKSISVPFHDDIFSGHIYPFASILKTNKCVFLKDYTIAVRIKTSQSRHIKSIYNKSPTQQWVEMFNNVYPGHKYKHIRNLGIKHIATHFVGLVQIKNFGPKGALQREIFYLLKYRWQNSLNLKFWYYVFITLLLPDNLLLLISDNYKKYILSKTIPRIRFEI